MNQTSSVVTTSAAITGAMLGQLIVYLCTVVRVAPPPPDVAQIIGALMLGGGHAMVNWINARWPAHSDSVEGKRQAPAAP